MRLIIGEDEALLRMGLSSLLTDEGHEVVAATSNAVDLVSTTLQLRPDLVITDIRMPPNHTRDGIDAALRIRALRPGTAVLVLSQHVDSAGATDLLSSGEGRIGYLLKHRIMDIDPFLLAIEQVLAGGSVIDPEVVASMISRRRNDNPVDGLSPRRRETLALMAEGYSNSRIAEALFVTEKAVARNIASIFSTLGLPPSADDHRRVLAVIKYLNR
ncbi:response regulator transcription factor [Nakamurella sp. PAMC28650]|uniref:response regulator transcription factor n=1 Tax=Nakamurella sp. PAMC28650 TaxID=2762325 RepID=UPI00164E7584|nr:response regulator transcription factor [Nakamurella sp. PAMC28650]QNK82114.1 response regulator transcription factor [Nakamurella sp. PAMC28650]